MAPHGSLNIAWTKVPSTRAQSSSQDVAECSPKPNKQKKKLANDGTAGHLKSRSDRTCWFAAGLEKLIFLWDGWMSTFCLLAKLRSVQFRLCYKKSPTPQAMQGYSLYWGSSVGLTSSTSLAKNAKQTPLRTAAFTFLEAKIPCTNNIGTLTHNRSAGCLNKGLGKWWMKYLLDLCCLPDFLQQLVICVI